MTPQWARPRAVVGAILAYCAVHFAVRMTMWPTLGIDDAEQALTAQHFAWAYRPQAPPLFTWTLLALGRLLGVNAVSISLIRYALMAVTFTLVYLTARRLIVDPRLAAVSVFSFAAIYLFAYYAHHDLTHTTMMTAMLALAWYVFVRLAETPKLRWYLALGLVFGLGLLSKWNFAMFAAALPLACLAAPGKRRLILTWRSVPAILLCGLIVAPTALTTLRAMTAEQHLSSVLVGAAPYPTRVAQGMERLLLSIVAYPEPLLALFLLIFGISLWHGWRRPAIPTVEPSGVLDSAFVGLTMAIALALHLALVLALGATELSERLMQPALLLLPVWLFMLVERAGAPVRAVNAFALLLLVLATATLAARTVVYQRGADHCGSCRAMVPFAALAAALKGAGYRGSGTILAEDFAIGGNMRVTFPGARIVEPGFMPGAFPAPSGSGQCLVLWHDRDAARTDGAKAFLSGSLADDLHGVADAPSHEGVVAERMFGSSTRDYQLGFRLYDDPNGECR